MNREVFIAFTVMNISTCLIFFIAFFIFMLFLQDKFGEGSLGTSKNLMSGQWEWEDFLLDDNINLGDFTK